MTGWHRKGFALLTIVVVAAVVLTLGAVVAVSLRSAEGQNRAQDAAADLLLVDAALTAFWQAAGRYPLQLSHLSTPPTTADKESCGGVWNSGWTSNWQTKAPFGPFYRKRAIPIGTGFELGIGLALDTMVRVPATVSGAGTLRIRIVGASEADAVELDGLIDASDGAGAGKVRWSAAVNGLVDTLNFIHTRVNSSC